MAHRPSRRRAPAGATDPVGFKILEAVILVIVEPVANEPVPVVTITFESKGKVLVTKPPIAFNLICPLVTFEVAPPVVPA